MTCRQRTARVKAAEHPMRNLFVICIALPVVTVSMAVANWARSDTSYPSHRNDVDFGANEYESPNGPFQNAANIGNPALAAACHRTAALWQTRLNADLKLIVHSPFVVAGDLSVPELEHHLANVILPTANAVQHTYSQTEPNEPILVLLFSQEDAYRRHTHRLFSQTNVSIYGYYKTATRTIGLNLAGGTGTLVHELTHALFDFDFPKMPLWLNEGIASLHEQAKSVGQRQARHFVGQINWRYPILSDAIRKGQLRSIRELIATADEFRGAGGGVNYAHARYLCMYLQQQGKLATMYKSLRSQIDRDRSGAATFKSLFPGSSWDHIDHDFQQWVIALDDSRMNLPID